MKPSKSLSAAPERRRHSLLVQQHPLLQGPQEINSNNVLAMRSVSKICLTEFTQRVMSGKLLQLREHQSQLTEALKNLQVAKEDNKSLNRLIKRQETHLRKYEGENAGMPRLLRAHAEEVRNLRQTVHHLRTELREVHCQLREKSAQVIQLQEALKKLKVIVEGENLIDNVKQEKKIEELQGLLEEQKEEIQTLTRRLLLESKNHRRALTSENIKLKEARLNLQDAWATIGRLEKEKRAILLGYTTSHRPVQHQCLPPANKDYSENDKKLQRQNNVSLAGRQQAVNENSSLKRLNFQLSKRNNVQLD